MQSAKAVLDAFFSSPDFPSPSLPTIHFEAVRETPDSAFGNGAGILLLAETSTGCLLAGSRVLERGQRGADAGREAAKDLVGDLRSGGCVDRYLQVGPGSRPPHSFRFGWERRVWSKEGKVSHALCSCLSFVIFQTCRSQKRGSANHCWEDFVGSHLIFLTFVMSVSAHISRFFGRTGGRTGLRMSLPDSDILRRC